MIKNEEVRKILETMHLPNRKMVLAVCKTICYIEDLEYRLQEAEKKVLGLEAK